MRKTMILLLCFAPFVVSDAKAQLNATEIPCDECRDPLQYPVQQFQTLILAPQFHFGLLPDSYILNNGQHVGFTCH